MEPFDVDQDPIRWGICGTGRIAEDFATGLGLVDDAEIVAVASHDPARSADFAGRHGIARSHHGYEALAADDDVDVVYVASTQERHARDTVLLLEAGRHVLCEKPFALSLADAERMIAVANQTDRFLMEALWSRFLPSYAGLRKLLDDGAIGTPLLLEANFSFRIPDESMDGHRLFDPERGGGALLDLGVYPVQLAHFVFGSPDRVHASGRLTPEGIDEQTTLMLSYDNGDAALLHTATRTPGSNSARIAGTNGVIDIAPFMHAANRITLTCDGDEPQVFDYPKASLHFQVPEVHRCLRAGLRESSVMPHSETLAIMSTLQQALDQVGVRYPSVR